MKRESLLGGPRFTLWLILIVFVLALGGCFWKKKTPEPEKSADQLYQEGLELIRDKRFEEARELFNKAKVISTETDLELLAQVAVADSYFEEEEYEAARAQYDEIFKLHSGSTIADYLQYRIGECFFWQVDAIDRDTSQAKKALQAFSRLVEDYPESGYLSLARLRIKKTHTFLAESEFFIGRFYLRKNAYLAAINRFKKALDLYTESGIEDKLLFYLFKAYRSLKDEDHALEYRRLLLERFPNSEYIPLVSSQDKEGHIPDPGDEAKGIRFMEDANIEESLAPAGLAGTYQGGDKDSWTRKLLLLPREGSHGRCIADGRPMNRNREQDMLQRTFLEKIIPW